VCQSAGVVPGPPCAMPRRKRQRRLTSRPVPAVLVVRGALAKVVVRPVVVVLPAEGQRRTTKGQSVSAGECGRSGQSATLAAVSRWQRAAAAALPPRETKSCEVMWCAARGLQAAPRKKSVKVELADEHQGRSRSRRLESATHGRKQGGQRRGGEKRTSDACGGRGGRCGLQQAERSVSPGKGR